MTDTDWLALADFLDAHANDMRAWTEDEPKFRAAADGLRQLAAITAAIGDPDELWQLALLLTAEGSPEMRRLKRIALAASDRRVYPSTADAAASLSPTPNPEGADMSTIRVSVLPEQAVAPPVVELVEATGIRSVEQWGFDTYNCGCALRHNDRHWVLCRYHDGMNDGLAMAAAPTPTPERCPQCGSTNPDATAGGCWDGNHPWHKGGQQ